MFQLYSQVLKKERSNKLNEREMTVDRPREQSIINDEHDGQVFGSPVCSAVNLIQFLSSDEKKLLLSPESEVTASPEPTTQVTTMMGAWPTLGNFQPTTRKAKPEVPDALFGPSNHTDEVAIEQVLTTEQLKLQKEKDLHAEEMLRVREREQKLSEDFEKMKKMLDDEVMNRQHAATCETNVKISDLEDTKVKQKQDEKSIAYLELENNRLQDNNDKLESPRAKSKV
ncbi:hypothetical protein D5F01_LYC05393 [Larimichthys crocea]|uniref:Uncharacterized protein n=1 Tax=Larimichthys crocea TaxID=215358 RepID=A0A6G0IZI2_LARCR|nr:hypothetical protein D5F01_LYC05393 [Larimichthys crocea]